MFRFIHTADIHLDSPLKSLALRDPQIADLVGGATRRTFEKIIDLCLDEQVHALIIAGDLYDGDIRSMKTFVFLDRQMRRLEAAGIRVFMIWGNHDSESTIKKSLPSNVHVFTGHGGTEELASLGVAIHGVSFAQRKAPQSLLYKYKPPVKGLINIGIMHTSLNGVEGHDTYAPCSIKDLTAHGFDYWALGHIHRRQIHADSPFVVMAGIPQGRDIGEEGTKSVTLVEISDQNIKIEERFVADTEFQRVKVDITDISEWSDAMTKLEKALRNTRENIKARHGICHIVLSGNTSLYWCLKRDHDRLREEISDMLQPFGNIFVDRIINQLTEPFSDSINSSDPVNELRSLMTEAANDSIFCSQAILFLEDAIKKLPFELRDNYGGDKNKIEDTLQFLLAEGITEVFSSLKDKQTKSEIF